MKRLIPLILSVIVLLVPFSASAYEPYENALEYENETVLNDLKVSVPTWKYTATYDKTYALDVDTPMYVYIVVDWQYLDYVTFSKDGFEMTQGECSLIHYNPDTNYVGMYAHISFNSKEEFIEELENLVPSLFFKIGELVSWYVPEQAEDTVNALDLKLNNQLMSQLNYNLSNLQEINIPDFTELMENVNKILYMIIGVLVGVGILIGSNFLKHFSFWKW